MATMQAVESVTKRPVDTFGLRLVAIRVDLGGPSGMLSIEEAANRCGLPPATWSTWERGAEPRRFTPTCELIAETLGYDALWLIRGAVSAAEQLALSLHSRQEVVA